MHPVRARSLSNASGSRIKETMHKRSDDSSGTPSITRCKTTRRIPIPARKHEIALVTALNAHIWPWRNENNSSKAWRQSRVCVRGARELLFSYRYSLAKFYDLHNWHPAGSFTRNNHRYQSSVNPPGCFATPNVTCTRNVIMLIDDHPSSEKSPEDLSEK
jgi:hypothetical protein